jgi:alkylhydroperoxidase family enzyme
LSDAHFEALAGDWESSDLFDAREKTVIRWSAALTENTAPGDDAAFAAMKEYFSERDIVELTLFCCLFNAWNRLQDGFHNPVEPLSEQVHWQDWDNAEASST